MTSRQGPLFSSTATTSPIGPSSLYLRRLPPGGFPTNALYGFCLMMVKILTEYRPESVIVAWDCREKTFRHEEFEEYKSPTQTHA